MNVPGCMIRTLGHLSWTDGTDMDCRFGRHLGLLDIWQNYLHSSSHTLPRQIWTRPWFMWNNFALKIWLMLTTTTNSVELNSLSRSKVGKESFSLAETNLDENEGCLMRPRRIRIITDLIAHLVTVQVPANYWWMIRQSPQMSHPSKPTAKISSKLWVDLG